MKLCIYDRFQFGSDGNFELVAKKPVTVTHTIFACTFGRILPIDHYFAKECSCMHAKCMN